MPKKKLEATSTLTISTREIAHLIAGDRVVVDETEIVLEEAADDQEPGDILEMVQADVETITESEEDDDEEEQEEEHYDESDDEDED